MSGNIDNKGLLLNDFLRDLRADKVAVALMLSISATLVFFYGFYPMFGPSNQQSALQWLQSQWNEETGYEHGYFILPIIVGLIWYDRKRLADSPVKGSRLGLWLILLAVVIFILSKRTVQARLAVGSLPILLIGLSLHLWGWRVTRQLAIPIGLIYFSISMPGLQQKTNSLQIFASTTAYHFSTLLGADVIQEGNNIKSANGSWDAFHVAEGCSGVRSLVALTLIAVVYGYVANRKLWKIAVLFLSAFPIAIVANAVRVTSIILIAEYINPNFAARTYHNWSGFVFFLLIGLAGLILVSLLLNKGWKGLKRKRRIIQHIDNTAAPGAGASASKS